MTDNAFAIGCFTTTDDQIAMTLALARSLRAHDNYEDIIVTCYESEPWHRHQLLSENIKIHTYDKIDYAALKKYPERLAEYDAQKLEYWNLAYETIIALDTDIICNNKITYWHTKDAQLIACNGPDAPLHSGIMMLNPSKSVYQDLLSISRQKFDTLTGWNDCGPVSPAWPNWAFQCAAASQGLLYYYFGTLKQSLRLQQFEYFDHYDGALKHTIEYKKQLASYGLTIGEEHTKLVD